MTAPPAPSFTTPPKPARRTRRDGADSCTSTSSRRRQACRPFDPHRAVGTIGHSRARTVAHASALPFPWLTAPPPTP
eukprot:scaffold4504_cov116-Isochrysis_galbana.AAC.1